MEIIDKFIRFPFYIQFFPTIYIYTILSIKILSLRCLQSILKVYRKLHNLYTVSGATMGLIIIKTSISTHFYLTVVKQVIYTTKLVVLIDSLLKGGEILS